MYQIVSPWTTPTASSPFPVWNVANFRISSAQWPQDLHHVDDHGALGYSAGLESSKT